MKKRLTVLPAIILGLLCAPVMADSATYLFQTSKHHIKVQCFGELSSLFSENCTYQAWNKPKKVEQGDPDLEINNGSANIESYMPVKGVHCRLRQFSFVDGDTAIHINRDYSSSQTCYGRKPGTNGDLTVHINGKLSSRYRLYEVEK